jgi:hypothetical protein
MLGRPLRISFALGRVRGASVIVPRLSTVRKNSNDMFVHFIPRNRSTPAINKLVFKNIVSTGLLSSAYIKSFYKSN